ncbi:thioredoxin domain-containing protein [Oscillatoria sp. CS-180]|uniref:thioredoxin family protein n=1 Tax=Oscillatoria sp. CS-180 TaxID=3021720 RepID=UPI0023302668|nr:thioredoxin domain-containing protein [Oscillatoria sp. CS-180]MDB9527535.1 thioredoxin domain-containing protein [Oscillatoria sp. CS-180]
MAIRQQFSSFEDLIADRNKPTLVSFYADWCGYCQQFAPILGQVKSQMGDRIKIVRISSEKYPQLASRYEIKSLPTSLIFVEGELTSRIKGVMEAPKLIKYLQKFL